MAQQLPKDLSETYRCETEGCPWFHAGWVVQPDPVQPGLAARRDVVCTGCGVVPRKVE